MNFSPQKEKTEKYTSPKEGDCCTEPGCNGKLIKVPKPKTEAGSMSKEEKDKMLNRKRRKKVELKCSDCNITITRFL